MDSSLSHMARRAEWRSTRTYSCGGTGTSASTEQSDVGRVTGARHMRAGLGLAGRLWTGGPGPVVVQSAKTYGRGRRGAWPGVRARSTHTWVPKSAQGAVRWYPHQAIDS